MIRAEFIQSALCNKVQASPVFKAVVHSPSLLSRVSFFFHYNYVTWPRLIPQASVSSLSLVDSHSVPNLLISDSGGPRSSSINSFAGSFAPSRLGPDPVTILLAKLKGVSPLVTVPVLALATVAHAFGHGLELLCLAVMVLVGPGVLIDAVLSVFKARPKRQLRQWTPLLAGGARGGGRGGRGRGGGHSQARPRPLECHAAEASASELLRWFKRQAGKLYHFPMEVEVASPGKFRLLFRDDRERAAFLSEFGDYSETFLGSTVVYPELASGGSSAAVAAGATSPSRKRTQSKSNPSSPKKPKADSSFWVWCSCAPSGDVSLQAVMARFGKPTGICPVGADPKVAAAIVGAVASPFPTGYFVRFPSHAAITRLKACPVKGRVFGVTEVTVEPCVAPSAGTSITECQHRAAIPTSAIINLEKGHEDIDRGFLRSIFSVHDDDVSFTIDPDDSSQLRVAFSSMDKCKAFFQSEVVPDEDANTFTWYIGHVQLSFSFTGSIVPVSLIIAPEDGVEPVLRCRFFPLRSATRDYRGWPWPEHRPPLAYAGVKAITVRTTDAGELVRVIETHFRHCEGALACAISKKLFWETVVAFSAARYGVQLVPSIMGFNSSSPIRPPTEEGDEARGPYCLLFMTSIPLSTVYHKSAMSRNIDGRFFFPSPTMVVKYVVWLAESILAAAALDVATSFIPTLSHVGATSVSPLWSLIAASRNRNETIVCASNYVHGAIGSHSLACFDCGQAEEAKTELSRRFGADASWQLVFVANARSFYEVVPAGGFFTLPPYYVLEALAHATQSALPRLGQLVFSSRLAAALVGRELMRIGLDSAQATLSVLSPISTLAASSVEAAASEEGAGEAKVDPDRSDTLRQWMEQEERWKRRGPLHRPLLNFSWNSIFPLPVSLPDKISWNGSTGRGCGLRPCLSLPPF